MRRHLQKIYMNCWWSGGILSANLQKKWGFRNLQSLAIYFAKGKLPCKTSAKSPIFSMRTLISCLGENLTDDEFRNVSL